jgi:putative copper export protein
MFWRKHSTSLRTTAAALAALAAWSYPHPLLGAMQAVERGSTGLPPGTGQSWAHLLGIVLLVGVAAFRVGVLDFSLRRAGLSSLADEAENRLARFGWVATSILLVTLVSRPFLRLREIGGEEAATWEFLPHVLFRTAWGGGWLLHLGVVVTLISGLVLLRRPGAAGRGWQLIAGAAVLAPLIQALQGHAVGSDARAILIPVSYLHVASAGIWLGGLLMLLLAGLPAVRRFPRGTEETPALASVVEGFSRMALLAVFGIVLAGVTIGLLHGIRGGDMVTSAWGRTLFLKLGLVGVAFLLWFYHWRRVRPTLSSHPDPGTLRIPATLEAAFGVVVLLVTAALVSLSLP